MKPSDEFAGGWSFLRREKLWLVVAGCVLLAFGANIEQRTALRRIPMTDLGVFSCASWAAWTGENLYAVPDWHGWHYQYPPALAILFGPLAHPLPKPPPALAPGEQRTQSNTPWGVELKGHRFYGLYKANVRFFCIVAIWYIISLLLFAFATHAISCTLAGSALSDGPPRDAGPRRRWWTIRLLPLLICGGSIGTDLSRGQVDGLMLAAVCLGLYLVARNREASGGLFLAFPAAVKLFPPLLLIYPVWRRRWRMALGVVAGLVLFLAIIPIIAFGPGRTIELYKVWGNVLAKPSLGQGVDKSRAGELTGMNSTDNQSLLAAIHNWRFHNVPRGKRPQTASAGARNAVYLAGALMLIGVGMAAGIRSKDSPQDLVLCSGLLVGLALVISPIVHNYYYLLIIPLVIVLLQHGLPSQPGSPRNWILLTPLVVFMATDIIVRLPGIGGWLRDLGLPLLSLLYLLGVGVFLLKFQCDYSASRN